MDSGTYLILITMGGRQSVQHMFSLSSSVGRPRIREKQVLKYLDLMTCKILD